MQRDLTDFKPKVVMEDVVGFGNNLMSLIKGLICLFVGIPEFRIR